MRIAIDARFVGRDRRGMGRYVTELTAALLVRGTDHEFVLLADDASADAARRLSSTAGRSSCVVQSVSATTRGSVDVCWCPWGRADVFVPGSPTVVTIHDLAPFAFPPRGAWRALDRVRDVRRLREAIARADGFVTSSEFTRRELMTRHGVGESRVVAIPEGVDPAFFAPLGAPRAGGDILWVGTDEERKNLPRLLEAFGRVRHLGWDLHLVLAGDNPRLLARHARQLTAAGLHDAVVVTGYLPDQALRRLYRTGRLFVCPSLYEGFGLPVIEAMASATPVVCSTAASLPEVAGDAAVYFDPRDVGEMTAAICRCLEDDALCLSLAARGRERAAAFTWDATAGRLLAVLCGAPAPAREADAVASPGRAGHA
jgi:alpha-1,3-rhamnosyl/mannosyltransferase